LYDRMLSASLGLLRSNGVFFDIGANIGWFSLRLCQDVRFSGTAHLFEPIPNLADICRQLLGAIQCQTIVHNIALGDVNEERNILCDMDGNIGWNTLIEPMRTPNMVNLPVAVRRFDDLGIDTEPDLIKIDVEGAEDQVLRGMMESLRRWKRKPVILCEIGWGQSHPHWPDVIATLQNVKALGYITVALDGSPLILHNITATVDALFLPH